MQYTSRDSEFEITLEPDEPATATVVLLHGLGADGFDFVPIVEELQLPEGRADAAGLAESVERVNAYLEQQIERGVPASRVVLAGFSQGGAVALSAGLRFGERLAGLLALSTYLPFPARLVAEKSGANAEVPILMCHGRMDPVVPVAMGIEARDVLSAQGYAVEWHEYPMEHAVCAAELAETAQWLRGVLAA